jgi:hypothetical protein
MVRKENCLTAVALALHTRAEADNVGGQRLGIVELRPIVLLEQLERELELVEQRQTAHGVRDGRFVHHHLLHVPDPPPGFAWS